MIMGCMIPTGIAAALSIMTGTEEVSMKTKPLRLPLNSYTLQTIANSCRSPHSLHRFLSAEIKRITEAYRWGLIHRWQALFALDEIRGMLPCSQQ
jgi:hypothetical protein